MKQSSYTTEVGPLRGLVPLMRGVRTSDAKLALLVTDHLDTQRTTRIERQQRESVRTLMAYSWLQIFCVKVTLHIGRCNVHSMHVKCLGACAGVM